LQLGSQTTRLQRRSLGGNIGIINKSTETLLDASRDVGLEVNVVVYVGVSGPECRPKWDIKIGNTSFENVSQFKYLETIVTNENVIQKEIRRRVNSGNAWYHSVQNHLSSRLLSKNRKVRIYRTIILPVVLYGCETWSLTLMEENKLSVFENRVLSRIFETKREGMTGGWGNCTTRSFIICTLRQVQLELSCRGA
jgi:hypothetical protein